MKKIITNYFKWHFKDRFYYMLTAIVLFLVIPPFAYELPVSTILTVYIFLSFVIVSCIVILFDNSRNSNYGLLILLLSLTITWFTFNPHFENLISISIIKLLILFLLFVFTAFKIIKTIFRGKKVNAQIIAGSVSAYLLFGLAGAMLFEFVDITFPASFDYNFEYGGGYDMVYYSFVTLSTLGYGDITPRTPQGQAAAILVTVVGQLYLAILMAILVGKFLKDSDW